MEDLKLKHAELSLDAEGWLRIRKLNGEEVAIQIEDNEPTLLAKWLEAASSSTSRAKQKRRPAKGGPTVKKNAQRKRGT